jgi:ribosome-associated protein
MSDTKPRKTDVQKLQRAIVDGLEDVKGQDIVVFNTEHLSPLFERVIIASGTSNRQTKALASSISDAVREAGFPKPRVEGEENGEWIIVDCGAAVAHVMQPSIRQYYHLEEIWGGKTVNLKQTAPAKPVAAESTKAAPAKGSKAAKAAADAPVKAKLASKAAEADAEVTTKPKAKATAAKTTSKTTSRSTAKDAVEAPVAKSAGKPAARLASKTVGKAAPVKAAASKTAAPKSAPTKTAARKTTAAAAPAAKVKTLVVGKPAVKKVAAKAPARKVATRKKAS